MSLSSHCETLTRLLLLWEAQVHDKLGYFPNGFPDLCRAHVTAYLTCLAKELREDLNSVEAALQEVQREEAQESAPNCASGA
jgi:hypothetical protein